MILVRNATLLDPATGALTEGASVLVEGERIREVSARPIKVDGALTLDAGGRTLMPGLIDCHVHVFLSEVNIRALEAMPLTLMTARGAGPHARHARPRASPRCATRAGPTGASGRAWHRAICPGPGSSSPGARSARPAATATRAGEPTPGRRATRCNALAFTMGIADGVDEVRRAVREQLRQGADHIKIMVSGGVASPHDPLESLQYTADEIRAAVRGGGGLRQVRVRARLRGGGGGARRRVRRPRDRARQSHRRRDRQADGRSRRLPRADAGRLRRHRAPRRALGDGRGEPREEQGGDGRGPALAGAGPRGGRAHGVRQRSARAAPARSVEGVRHPRAGALAARDHPLGHGGGRGAARAHGRARASSRPARSRTSSWWTATRCAISPCCRARASTCRSS